VISDRYADFLMRAAGQGRGRILPVVAMVALLLSGCGAPAPGDQATPDDHAGTRVQPDQAAASHEHPVAAPDEGESLLAIMQRLNTDMTGLSQALWMEDWSVMTARAAAIANHAPIAATEIERIHAILGEEMHAFEEVDEAVHTAAVRMHQSAEARDLQDFLAAFSDVQQGCVSCHTSFRDRLRTVTP